MKQDKELLRNRFSANLDSYAESAVVQREICRHLAKMIAAAYSLPEAAPKPAAYPERPETHEGPAEPGTPEAPAATETPGNPAATAEKVSSPRPGTPAAPRTALETGVGTGFLTGHLFGMFPECVWTINDLVERSGEYVSRIAGKTKYSCLYGDAETIALPATDLVASASTVQWFDDLPGFIHKVYRSLNPGGRFCFSTFGPRNFHEIRSCSGVGLEYCTAEELTAILRSDGFTVTGCEEFVKILEFDSPIDVLRHIRTTGVNSVENVRWTRKDLEEFGNRYRSGFSTPAGKATLTYHPIFITAKK